jgi:hypothetical protein
MKVLPTGIGAPDVRRFGEIEVGLASISVSWLSVPWG